MTSQRECSEALLLMKASCFTTVITDLHLVLTGNKRECLYILEEQNSHACRIHSPSSLSGIRETHVRRRRQQHVTIGQTETRKISLADSAPFLHWIHGEHRFPIQQLIYMLLVNCCGNL